MALSSACRPDPFPGAFLFSLVLTTQSHENALCQQPRVFKMMEGMSKNPLEFTNYGQTWKTHVYILYILWNQII